MEECVHRTVDYGKASKLVPRGDSQRPPRPVHITSRLALGCGLPVCGSWGHFHIMWGAMLWYDESADPDVLAFVVRIGDLLVKTFGGDPKRLYNIGNLEENQTIICKGSPPPPPVPWRCRPHRIGRHTQRWGGQRVHG